MKKLKFEELNISKNLLKAILNMGFSQATPIQAQAIPEIFAGRDLIGQASTGTGKTAAFAIPAIEKIDAENKNAQILVLCPTRELAMQVAVEFNKLLRYKKNIYALPIYGGQPIFRQFCALKRGAQIIIGTPGRTLDHIKRGTLKLNQVKMVILDEADEMLDMGFRADIEKILQTTPKNRQTILFSATMSPEIMHLTKNYQKNPKIIRIAQEQITAKAIEQIYLQTQQNEKMNTLINLITKYNPKLSIVFCNSRRKVDTVARTLNAKGYKAAGIHGDVRQTKRDLIMSKFRNNNINILVATDIAARGLDVANVEAVFNYEIPREVESYIHRIGRTGRAGKTGRALSLVSDMENFQFRKIKHHVKTNIELHN
ncbi:DEAD/DEAH box helicase [Candidatus Babeliales bacterium]|nr:DEAD/DEAH box helicase [Candidatus Babeliales bacterium]MCF7899450.1 DEAD/DEAH box helicase [Candidatus Babeliales bacterium]